MVMEVMVEGERKKKENILAFSQTRTGNLTLNHVGKRNVALSLMESLGGWLVHINTHRPI
jgi:hypothetical protein